jgi:hypothetical protein
VADASPLATFSGECLGGKVSYECVRSVSERLTVLMHSRRCTMTIESVHISVRAPRGGVHAGRHISRSPARVGVLVLFCMSPRYRSRAVLCLSSSMKLIGASLALLAVLLHRIPSEDSARSAPAAFLKCCSPSKEGCDSKPAAQLVEEEQGARSKGASNKLNLNLRGLDCLLLPIEMRGEHVRVFGFFGSSVLFCCSAG